jgi:protein-tyrosine phosphatase
MRAGAAEISPGKLYQRGNFLKWPYAQKHRLLTTLGVTMVVNMWGKVDPDLSTEDQGRTYLNWLCSPSSVPPNADLYIQFITDAMKAGHNVLVHCEAGRGRSVWMAARLLAAYEGIPKREALARVQVAVPGHKLTPTLRADLESDDAADTDTRNKWLG